MTVLNIPITKAKTTMAINTDSPEEGGDLPADVYAEALALGLKVLLNRGTSKVTSSTYSNPEELKVRKVPKRMLPVGKTFPWLEAVDQMTQHEPALARAIRLLISDAIEAGAAPDARASAA